MQYRGVCISDATAYRQPTLPVIIPLQHTPLPDHTDVCRHSFIPILHRRSLTRSPKPHRGQWLGSYFEGCFKVFGFRGVVAFLRGLRFSAEQFETSGPHKRFFHTYPQSILARELECETQLRPATWVFQHQQMPEETFNTSSPTEPTAPSPEP